MEPAIVIVPFILMIACVMLGCTADPLGETGDGSTFWLILMAVVVVVCVLAAILPKIFDRRSAAKGFESNPLLRRIAEAARSANPTHVVVTPEGVTFLGSPEAFMLSEGGELTLLPQGRVKEIRALKSWSNDVLGRFSNHIVSGDETNLAYFDFEKEGYRSLNFEYLGYFAETLLKEMGGDYTILPCQLLIEDVDPTLNGARVTGNSVSPTYSHDVTITELFGCHHLVRRELASNVPTIEQIVDQYAPKSWF